MMSRSLAGRIPGRLVGLLLLLVWSSLGCTTGSEAAEIFHCPMHPTYVSERQGDCPICGMRLVRVGPVPVQAPQASDPGAPPAAADQFVCRMCPGVVHDAPGRCPECGMELEPVPVGGGEAFGVADRVALDVSARGAELAGIVTLEVVRAPLIRVVRAFGQVVVDETRVRHVHTKVPGTVERLYARFTGQLVRRGQPLLGLYSPDLLSTQQELLRAAEGARRLAVSGSPEAGVAAAGLLASARRRLELYDVPAAWIDRLLERGKPERVVVLGSPVSGVVLEKSTFEGHRVTPDMELLVVADLSQVWVQAALFEHEASSVRVGQPARLRAPASVGPEVRTSVAWVAPVVDPATRTVAVRFELPNPELRLRPGSFADVWLEQDLGEALLVPEGAVVDSGSRRLVYVEVRPGRFAPRVVQLGARADGRVQVLHGLEAGERVASQGTFLLDSEASLRANLARVGHDPRAGHEPHADHVH